MLSASKIKANRAWDSRNMVNLACRVRRDFADQVRDACRANGDTVNAVIKRALLDYLEKNQADKDP